MFVVFAHGRSGFFAILGFAVEGFVNRMAEGVPQLLLKFAIQRHALRLVRPLLLQGFDGVHAQYRHRAQRLRLFNHSVTAVNAVLLGSLQR